MLDDVTPRYAKASAALNTRNASLDAALQFLLDAKTSALLTKSAPKLAVLSGRSPGLIRGKACRPDGRMPAFSSCLDSMVARRHARHPRPSQASRPVSRCHAVGHDATPYVDDRQAHRGLAKVGEANPQGGEVNGLRKTLQVDPQRSRI